MTTARAMFLSVLLAASTWVVAAPAGAAPPPTVSVASGPVTTGFVRPACSDAIQAAPTATTFVFTRLGDTTGPLDAAYSVGGPAVSGQDYVALPGTLTFAANTSTATVTIQPIAGPEAAFRRLSVTVVDGAAYDIASPASAEVTFLQPRDATLPPTDCGFFFESYPIERTVAVGGSLAPISLEEVETNAEDSTVDPSGVTVRLTSGTLPPGVTLLTSGAFSGTPKTAGTYSGHVEACRAQQPGFCDDVDLIITVTAAPGTSSTTSSTIPVTGAATRSTGLFGAALLGLGLVALGTAMRRPAAAAQR